MTKIYRYRTGGERIAVHELPGGYLVSGPLTPEQVADIRSDPDDVTIDGEIVDALDTDLEDVTEIGAVARQLGSRGGHASAAALTPEQRKERGHKAIAARWARRKDQ